MNIVTGCDFLGCTICRFMPTYFKTFVIVLVRNDKIVRKNIPFKKDLIEF